MLDVLPMRSTQAIALVGYLLLRNHQSGTSFSLASLRAELQACQKHDVAYPLALEVLSNDHKGLLAHLDESTCQVLCAELNMPRQPDGLVELEELSQALVQNGRYSTHTPDGTAELLAELGADAATDTVLCLSLNAMPIAIRYARRGIRSLITGVPPWFAVIVQMLSNGQIMVANEDESFLKTVRRIDTMGLVVGYLPARRMAGPSPGEIDDLELQTLQTTAQLIGDKGRAVLLSRGGLVSRTTPQYREFKQELLSSNHLAGVIALPGTQTDFANSYILVLDKRLSRLGGRVRMVNACQEKYRGTADRSRRIALQNVEEVIQAFHCADTRPGLSGDVTADSIRDQRYTLEVQRYVLSELRQRAITLLGNLKTSALQDIADLVRAQALASPSEDEAENLTIRETALTDLDEWGRIQRPQHERAVGQDSITKQRLQEQRLCKGDVILSCKSRIGAVGLLTEDVAPEIWTVNQSFLILRVKPNMMERLPPEILFWYLRSDLAQEWLRMHTSGNAVPMLSTNDLRNMPIPLPTLKEVDELMQHIDEHFALHDQVQRCRDKAARLQQRNWALAP